MLKRKADAELALLNDIDSCSVRTETKTETQNLRTKTLPLFKKSHHL